MSQHHQAPLYSAGSELPADTRRYVILRKLNSGGTSIVFEGVDRLTSGHPSVAVKVIDLQHADERLRLRLQNEVAIGSKVTHPFLVSILDCFVDGRALVIIEEHVKGWDLLDVLNRTHGGALDEEHARQMFIQLLEGVTYLHSHGVAHRDIKPENVMIEAATGSVKIIDLGLSKHLTSARTLGIGTPGYIAPELILRGDPLMEHPEAPYDSTKADVFSLGATLYLMLCGWHAFEDPANPRDVTHMLRNQIKGLCRPLPYHLGRSPVAKLLQVMLIPNPAKRATLQQIWEHPWVVAGLERRRQLKSAGALLGESESNGGKLVAPAPEGPGGASAYNDLQAANAYGQNLIRGGPVHSGQPDLSLGRVLAETPLAPPLYDREQDFFTQMYGF